MQENFKQKSDPGRCKTGPSERDTRICPDLNPYIQNLIMVDGVDEVEDTICTKHMEKLRMLILSYFIATLPCVAIGTLRHGQDGWKDSTCLVQKSIPVLYIDIRERPPDLSEEMIKLRRKVEEKKANWKEMDECEEMEKAKKEEPKPEEDPPGSKNPGLKLFEITQKYCDQEWEWLACHKRYDVLDVCRIAFWHSIWERVKNRLLAHNSSKLQVSDYELSIYDAIELAKIKTEAGSIYEQIEQRATGLDVQIPKDEQVTRMIQVYLEPSAFFHNTNLQHSLICRPVWTGLCCG
jgi:hypothetical protein